MRSQKWAGQPCCLASLRWLMVPCLISHFCFLAGFDHNLTMLARSRLGNGVHDVL
jgi:hypothetical protein